METLIELPGKTVTLARRVPTPSTQTAPARRMCPSDRQSVGDARTGQPSGPLLRSTVEQPGPTR